MKTSPMKRVILFALFILALGLSAQAQELRTVYLKYREGKALLFAGNVSVYTFKTKAQADRAAEMLASGGAAGLQRLGGFIASSVTDASDGACYVKMAKDGYMVVDPEKIITDDELQIEVVSTKATNANGDVEYVLGSNNPNKGEKTETLREVESKGKRKLMNAQDQVMPRACGNRITFPPVKVLVDSAYARANARFIVAPVVYKNGEIDQAFAPTVLDGKPYRDSQYRRMGYNLENDKLYPFAVAHFMGDYKKDVVYTQPFVFDYEKGAKYKGIARVSYEDYNAVYHEDTYEWWDGRLQDPMRFLDWDDVKKSIPMDYLRYKKEGRAEKRPQVIKGLQVNYPVGSEEIDLSDSATIRSIQKIVENIRAYYDDDDSFIERISVRGFASPEGLEASNRRLGEARSRSLGRWVRKTFPRSDKLYNNFDFSQCDIVPWSEVADSLEARFKGDPMADQAVEELRDIISKFNTLDAQWAQIRQRDWFGFVNQEILPRMRRVDIEYTTVTSRVKTPQEIYDGYRLTGLSYLNTAKAYEYYELLKRFIDSGNDAEAAKVAEVAYKSDLIAENVIRHDRDSITRNREDGTISFVLKPSDWTRRPYPLAAYCLAKSKLARHEVDTVMLKNYIDWSGNGLENKKTWRNQEAGWWNDEALVVLQVLMYCEAKDYHKAHDLCTRHLSDNPKYERLKMFIRCMNCEWDNPEVRDYIAQSSSLNNAVVTMAQNTEQGYRDALYILDTDSCIDNKNADTWYMRAICRFQLETDDVSPGAMAYFATACYDPDPEIEGKPRSFAAPMLEAFRLDPSNVEFIDTDGYFNDSYRLLVWFFWKGQNEGKTMEQIAEEYNHIRSKYYLERKGNN